MHGGLFYWWPGAESHLLKCWAFRAISEKVTAMDPTKVNSIAIQPFNQTHGLLYPNGHWPTHSFNPTIAVPCGFGRNGMSIGLQAAARL